MHYLKNHLSKFASNRFCIHVEQAHEKNSFVILPLSDENICKINEICAFMFEKHLHSASLLLNCFWYRRSELVELTAYVKIDDIEPSGESWKDCSQICLEFEGWYDFFGDEESLKLQPRSPHGIFLKAPLKIGENGLEPDSLGTIFRINDFSNNLVSLFTARHFFIYHARKALGYPRHLNSIQTDSSHDTLG